MVDVYEEHEKAVDDVVRDTVHCLSEELQEILPKNRVYKQGNVGLKNGCVVDITWELRLQYFGNLPIRIVWNTREL